MRSLISPRRASIKSMSANVPQGPPGSSPSVLKIGSPFSRCAIEAPGERMVALIAPEHEVSAHPSAAASWSWRWTYRARPPSRARRSARGSECARQVHVAGGAARLTTRNSRDSRRCGDE
jgi:hypothetical protein